MEEEASAPAKSARGQKLWAVLLVLDSFFVIIFGGALAAKVYQHWQAPPPLPTRRPKPVAAKPAEPAQASTAAAKPAEAPKPEPVKPVAKAEPAPNPNAPRPPKPSLLHEAPRREAAHMQGAGAPSAAPAAAPSAAPAAPANPMKAVPVEFTYKGNAKRVELVGAFIVRGGKKAMIESAPGVWTLTLYLTPNTYRYHYFVNGKKVLDSGNPKSDRGMSVITVEPAR